MEKHLVLIDLDGTLLSSDKKISDYNKEAIKKVVELGHEVIIATGRAHYRSHMYYEELGLKSLLVNRNAGHIHSPHDDNFDEVLLTIDHRILEPLTTTEHIKKIFYEYKNDVYIIKGNNDFYLEYPLCNLRNEFINESVINLMSMFVDNNHVSEIENMLKEIDNIYYEVFRHNGEYSSTFFNVYPKGANKYQAIKHLMEYYQVKNEHIIAIGDEINDIEMIKNVGIGVAMGNASQGVKDVADVILEETHDDSGVGKFLTRFFKL